MVQCILTCHLTFCTVSTLLRKSGKEKILLWQTFCNDVEMLKFNYGNLITHLIMVVIPQRGNASYGNKQH